MLLAATCYSQTFKDNCTTYYVECCYSHGGNKVKRSEANKKAFLKSKGLIKCPVGYEIDHIIPLSQGGSDCPDNMQLLTIAEHRKKTGKERNMRNHKPTKCGRYKLFKQ